MNGYQQQYTCIKCGNHNFEEDQLQATGGNFSKIFDVQNKKFITISCSQCGYLQSTNEYGNEYFRFFTERLA